MTEGIPVDLNELKELISMLEDSKLSELEIEEEGRRIRLTKQSETYISVPAPVQMQAPAPVAAPAPAVAPSTPFGSAQESKEPSLADQGLVAVTSPMVGTFYLKPAPSEPAFVEPGDRVTADQTVCIVEAMKIMNEVAAKVAGIVERILVENGEPVEFGQPLFAIRPS
jgi:acetyl-CoA carboxylase biotin carboxyl carrier protein